MIAPKIIASLTALAVLASSAFFASARSHVRHVGEPYAGRPEVVAASFVSAWCPACKVMTPKLAHVLPEFRDQPIKFTELDFSLGQSPKLAAKAAADGYSVVYARFAGATGFTLLIDRDTGEVLDRLTMDDSEDVMRTRIKLALAKAENTPAPAQ